MRLAPDRVDTYANLTNYAIALQRFDETRQIIQETQARKLDDYTFHNALYALAFLRADSAAMAEQQQWFAGNLDYENFGFALTSDSEAYDGHMGKARELTKRAVVSAIRTDSKENGAIWQAIAAPREAAYGNTAEARRSAAEALKLAPTSEGVGVETALAFAIAGDTARAESMAQDLNKRFPLDTQMQSLWLPAVRAQMALEKKNPTLALNIADDVARRDRWLLCSFGRGKNTENGFARTVACGKRRGWQCDGRKEQKHGKLSDCPADRLLPVNHAG